MKIFFAHIRSYIVRGLFAIIPLLLSYSAIRFLYVFIDQRFVGFFNKWFGFSIPGLGILLVIVVLYFIGLIASNVIGKQIFNVIEEITKRIPIIKSIYQLGRQLSQSLSPVDPEKQAFKRSILVDVHKTGVWTVGFVTGTCLDEKGQEYIRVFVPTVPNPTTGFVILVKPEQTMDPQWTVEETMKVIISGGIIGPEKVKNK